MLLRSLEKVFARETLYHISTFKVTKESVKLGKPGNKTKNFKQE